MTDPNRSHITLVCDRTGSMQRIRADAEGGVNAFLDDQKKLDQPCTLLLVQFDDVDPFEILHAQKLEDYHGPYQLEPRGSTPLLDAIGRAIVHTGKVLATLPEDQRPGHVFFVTQTDGQENASKEYTWEQVRKLISEHENTWNWTFIWLGTGPDSWSQFERHLHGTRSVSNVVAGQATGQSVNTAYASTSYLVTEGRTGKAPQTYGGKVDAQGNWTKNEEEGESPDSPNA